MTSRRILLLIGAAIVLLAGAWCVVGRTSRTASASSVLIPIAPGSENDDVAHAREPVGLVANRVASERALPDKPAVRGRVIDAQTGAPVAHWTVRMYVPKAPPDPAVERKLMTEVVDIMRERTGANGADVKYIVDGQTFRIELGTNSTVNGKPDGSKPPPAGDAEPMIVSITLPKLESPNPSEESKNLGEPSGGQIAPPPDVRSPSGPLPLEPNAAAPFQSDSNASVPDVSGQLLISVDTLRADKLAENGQTAAADRQALQTQIYNQISFNSYQNGTRIDSALPMERVRWFVEDKRYAMISSGNLHRPSRAHRSQRFRSPQFNRDLTDVLETTTDDDGRFEFVCPAHDGASLELEPDEHSEIDEATRDLGPAASACSREITWKVTLRRIGKLHGRVVDARTHEPVRGLDVGLREASAHGDGFRWGLVTNEEGEFSRTIAAGLVQLEFADGATQEFVVGREEFEFTARNDDASPIEFQVHAGPTFRFLPRLAADEVQGDLALRFVNLAPADLAPGHPNPLAEWRADDLHKDDCVWFRGPSTVRREHDGPIYAEWKASGGLLVGRVEIASTTPVDPNPLPVSFSPAASVHGTVGRSLVNFDWAVVVQVRVLDAEGAVLGEWTTDNNGEYSIQGLDARRAASIEASHPTLGRVSASLALRNGEATEVDLEFK